MKFLMLVVADPSRDGTEEPPITIEEWVGETYGNGKVTVTDGPFAETHEWIAGFDILDCADLDEAIELASRHPMATSGIIDLRPAWPLDLA